MLPVIASHRRLSACLSDLWLDGVPKYPASNLSLSRCLALLKVGTSQPVFRHRQFIAGSRGALERQPHGELHGRQTSDGIGFRAVFRFSYFFRN